MQKHNWSLKILFLLFFVFLIISPEIARASSLITVDDLGLNYGEATGLGSTDVRTTVASIIRVALGLLGIVAVAAIFFGGFLYMTSGGEESKSSKGTKVITAGIIGLVIILCAYAIASFIISQLVAATTGT